MKILKDILRDHGMHPTGILHVGASFLEEADQYQEMGVGTVIWVEAQPKSDRRYERAHQFKHMLYEACPLSDVEEDVTLRMASNLVSSSILPFKRHSEIYPDIVVTKEIHLKSRRADKLFAHFPPEIDTLVLDVQGAELKVLKGMGNLLDQIQRVFTETELKELYEGCVLEGELKTWLAAAGFKNWETFDVHLDEWREALAWR